MHDNARFIVCELYVPRCLYIHTSSTLIITFTRLSLSQKSPLFLRVCSTSLLKTKWKNEKLLVTSHFSFKFSHSVCVCVCVGGGGGVGGFVTHLENFLPFSSILKLSSANIFSLEESKICRLGKGMIRTSQFI